MAEQKESQKMLEEIRGRLMGDPSRDELEMMRLQIDALANMDILMADADPGHHHDHMDDHDHAHLALGSIDLVQRPVIEQRVE